MVANFSKCPVRRERLYFEIMAALIRRSAMHKLSPVIAPSILSANFARLGEEASAVIEAGADWIHFDVMDNHYVPNLTIGPMGCEALRNYGITIPIDVHLMVEPVDALANAFARAGASSITFHPEATRHVDRSLTVIRNNGCQAGVVLNPATSLDCLSYVLDKVDIVLLMSVNPGFGGQEFIPAVLEKIKQARLLLDRYMAQHPNRHIRLEVDGGVNVDNIGSIAGAGADTFVAGSAVFGSQNYADTIRSMRAAVTAI